MVRRRARIMKCPFCNEEIENSTKICPICGEKIPTLTKLVEKIKGIKFNVAEKPAWAKKAITYATIANVPLPSVYYVKDESCRPSVPVVAEFDDIVVSSITITIAVKDRVMLYAKDGSVNTDINISEVVVLGRK